MRHLLLIIIVLAAVGLLPAAEPVRLLFAGSSSMYWNDLPRAVAGLVDGRISGLDGRPVEPEAVGRSGSDIKVYREEGFDRYEYGVRKGQTFLQKIAEERPRLVVLMAVCGFIMAESPPDRGHADALTAYVAAIRAAGGEPVIYEMGWGRGDTEDEGRTRIRTLAKRLAITRYAPCSSAWAKVYKERPDLALQHPKDKAHPGDLGHFLNLACFYAALTRSDPRGALPRTYAVWPHDNPAPTDEAGRAAEAARLAAFTPDAYQARMARWMFRHMSLRLTATVDDETARYLETVAWETWTAADAELRGAMP